MKRYKDFINEIYSADKEEITEFLDNLPDKLILYRGLIVLKENNEINREHLGINWTMDKYFAENLFRYDTFGGGAIEYMEEYFLYVITAEFDKDDIDIEKTIDKRLIKDKGHFWDELSGEMIENPDMEFHPYSHEDEIMVKKSAKPKILDVKEIDLAKFVE